MKKIVSLCVLFVFFVAVFVISVQAAELRRGTVSISVDDSVPSLYNDVFPILDGYGLPFTAYIITGRVGDDEHVNWKQIREMHRAGVEIGNHSNTHPDFSLMSYPEILRDIRRAQRKLAAHGIRAKSFAYPFGYASELVTKAVKAAGLKNGRGAWDEYDKFNVPATFNKWWIESLSFCNPLKFTDIQPLIDNDVVIGHKHLSIVLHSSYKGAAGQWELPSEELEAMAKYLADLRDAGQIEIMTVTEAVKELQYYKNLP